MRRWDSRGSFSLRPHGQHLERRISLRSFRFATAITVSTGVAGSAELRVLLLVQLQKHPAPAGSNGVLQHLTALRTRQPVSSLHNFANLVVLGKHQLAGKRSLQVGLQKLAPP